jgi:hypothetical protein
VLFHASRVFRLRCLARPWEGVDDEVYQVLNCRKIRLFCVIEHALRKISGSWRTLSAPAQIGLSAATSPLFATTTAAVGRLCKLFLDYAWRLEFHLTHRCDLWSASSTMHSAPVGASTSRGVEHG